MVIGESYLIFCIFINNFSKIFMLPKYDLSESMNSFQTVSWVSLWFRAVSGESHGRRSLVGCSPWGCEESDMTEQLHFSLLCIGEGHGNPLQCSCLENPRDEGAWWAAVYGVAQSRTRLKRLSSSNRSSSSASQTLHTGITRGSCFWCRFWLAGPRGCGLLMLRVCISHQLPGGGGAAGPWSTFWVDLWNIVANCLRVLLLQWGVGCALPSYIKGFQPLGHGLVLICGLLEPGPHGRWVVGDWVTLHFYWQPLPWLALLPEHARACARVCVSHSVLSDPLRPHGV